MVFELFLQNKEKELQKNKLRKERKKMWIERALVEKKEKKVDLKFEAKVKSIQELHFLFQRLLFVSWFFSPLIIPFFLYPTLYELTIAPLQPVKPHLLHVCRLFSGDLVKLQAYGNVHFDGNLSAYFPKTLNTLRDCERVSLFI
jgi:hypothetical protein